MGGQVGVLPRTARRDVLLARPDAVPGREPEIGVLGGMLDAFQDVRRNVGFREVGYRIAARFKEQNNVLAIGDPDSPEAHAHAPTQRLDVQQSLGQRFWYEKPADCSRRERTLLPGQTHCFLSLGLMFEANRRSQAFLTPDSRSYSKMPSEDGDIRSGFCARLRRITGSCAFADDDAGCPWLAPAAIKPAS